MHYFIDTYREMDNETLEDATNARLAVAYIRDLFKTTEKSYTFIHFDSVDGAGHDTGWCSHNQYEKVAATDKRVRVLFICFFMKKWQRVRVLFISHNQYEKVAATDKHVRVLFTSFIYLWTVQGVEPPEPPPSNAHA